MNPVKKRAARVGKHLLFWLAYLMFYVGLAHPYRDLTLGELILLFSSSLPLDMLLVYFHLNFLIPRFLLTRRLVMFGLIFGAVALVMVVVKRFASFYVLQPLFVNTPRPEGFEFWNLAAMAFSVINLYAVVFLAASIKLVSFWMETNQRRLQLENQNKSSELALLRMQVNPHFLFNSLNNIHTLIGVDTEKASDALLLLSGILRYMLYGAVSEKVFLRDEITYLQDYVGLQQLRFAHPGMIRFAVEGDAAGWQIAPMLLIPFVENAFKHHDKLNEQANISIRMGITGGLLVLEVSNAIRPAQPVAVDEGGGIGLLNVRRRLELLYDRKHSLEVTRTERLFFVKLTVDLA